jgi:hypothetical protein
VRDRGILRWGRRRVALAERTVVEVDRVAAFAAIRRADVIGRVGLGRRLEGDPVKARGLVSRAWQAHTALRLERHRPCDGVGAVRRG